MPLSRRDSCAQAVCFLPMSTTPLFRTTLSLVVLLACRAYAADSSLPRATPESQGISSKALAEYIEAADKQIDTMHSFMLVRHGHVIAEAWWSPDAADKPHVLW